MKFTAINPILLSYLAYSNAKLERNPETSYESQINSDPFQNKVLENLPAMPSIVFCDEASESIAFFKRYMQAIYNSLELYFSFIKLGHKHKRISDFIAKLKTMIILSNHLFIQMHCAIHKIKIFHNKKDLKNSDFNEISENNEVRDSAQLCLKKLKPLDKLKERSFSWLKFVEKELNKFLKDSKGLHESFRQIIQREVRWFGVVSDEEVKLKFENKQLSSLYETTGKTQLELCEIFGKKHIEYFSNLNCFRRIFCELYQNFGFLTSFRK